MALFCYWVSIKESLTLPALAACSFSPSSNLNTKCKSTTTNIHPKNPTIVSAFSTKIQCSIQRQQHTHQTTFFLCYQKNQLSWLLAVILLVGVIVASPLKFALRAPRPHSLSLNQGEDTMSVLRQVAQSLNRGRPGGWERLMNAPSTSGSHGINAIHPSEMRNVVQS